MKTKEIIDGARVAGWLRFGRAAARVTKTAAAIALLAFVGTVLVPSAATAAPPYYNSDPYATRCAQNSYVLGSGAVPGGRINLAVSRSCGTNWIEYVGTRQTVKKRISCPDCDPYAATTRWETDTASWSWSMQVYAPRSGDITYGTAVVRGVTYQITCGRFCSFRRL